MKPCGPKKVVESKGGKLIEQLRVQRCSKKTKPESPPRLRQSSVFEDDMRDVQAGASTATEVGGGDADAGKEVQKFPPKVRVDIDSKFRPGVVKELIEKIVREVLGDKEYSSADAKAWAVTLTDMILQRTKELNFERYKIIVSVIIGEKRGQGVVSAYRSLWDAESDCGASFTFTNDTIYCTALVCGVYYY